MQQMNRVLLASTALGAGLISGAHASDLPTHKAPAAPTLASPVYNWTGFYVGANLGVDWSRSSSGITYDFFDELSPGPSSVNNPAGVIGGVQAGYNWQFSSLVLGVEADADLSSARRNAAFDEYLTHNSSLSALGTIRARAGWAFDRWLPYVTGGVAFADLKNSLNDDGLVFSRNSSATGWVVGGGLEYALTDHWTVKAEYLYAQFPNSSGVVGSSPYLYRFKDTDSDQIARVGVNYKF